MQSSEPIRRTQEIEDLTNLYFIHPMANRLTPILRDMRISANAVSVMGMVFGLLAGLAYFYYQDLRYACIGLMLMIAWHVMDGVDGQLARMTHSQSEVGKVLDGICDYVTFIAVYAGFAVGLAHKYGNVGWVLVVIAGICHAAQSAAYEAQRQAYEFWGWGRESKRLVIQGKSSQVPGSRSVGQFLLLPLSRLYTSIQFRMIGFTADFYDRLDKKFDLHKERIATLRQCYREVFAQSVRHWSIMSANYRTIAIFIFASMKTPLFYFLFEILFLNIILIGLLYRQHARYVLFLNKLHMAE